MIVEGYKLTKDQKAELNRLDVFRLRSVSDRNDLPQDPGVYFLIVNSEVLYVGQTWRLRRRWQMHVHKSHLDNPNARIAFLIVAQGLGCVRGEIERLFIKRFKPPLNKLGCGEISIPG